MAAPQSPAAKTERLLNLVIALLYTRQLMTKQQIRAAVPAYQGSSPEAFDRMFERDKEELRDLGIPLRAELVDDLFEDETGYRIDRREYGLPEISFEPDELAVLGLASRAWAQASLGGAAAGALRKLEAAGVQRDAESIVGLEPHLLTREPAFEAVKEAVVAGQPITFDYRRSGSTEASTRHLEPWGIANWRGRWYVTGHDTDRGEARVFRLSRIEGPVRPHGEPGGYTVPAGHDPRAAISAAHPVAESHTARLLLAPGAANTLRLRGEVEQSRDDGDVVEIGYTDVFALADEVAGFGPAAQVLEPEELRGAVVTRLRGVLQAHAVGEGA